MSTLNGDALEIPTALPGLEDEKEREDLLQSANASTEDLDPEEEVDEELDLHDPPNKSKRIRALKAAAGLMIFFIVLFATVSWFFGIGMFSDEKPQPINRTAKGETQAPVSEDEKLKMALSMVAAREPSPNTETSSPESESSTVPIATEPTEAGTDPFKTTSSLTDDLVGFNAAPVSATKGENKTVSAANSTSNASQQANGENQPDEQPRKQASKSDEFSPGRSVFFGKERKSAVSDANIVKTNYRQEVRPSVDSEPASIPFGTLLPIRLTSAVYSFRNSGGFIRMELTRAVEGKGYVYPAGTAVVGTLRGAESARVFVTVTGLIDPVSSQLVKVGGEVLGRDGASGIQGRRRKVTGVWSRLLRGLRETGSSIFSSIASWRSGGTVVITDSMRRVGNDIPRSSDSYVQVDAGSMGFVQVTGLPDEASATGERLRTTESGLTDEELADLFSGSSADNLRAAMPRMTPEFRRLAEKALENSGGR